MHQVTSFTSPPIARADSVHTHRIHMRGTYLYGCTCGTVLPGNKQVLWAGEMKKKCEERAEWIGKDIIAHVEYTARCKSR